MLNRLTRGLGLLLLISFHFRASAQDSLAVSETAFLRQVLKFHPSLQAEAANIAIAEEEVRSARAAFDPIWQGEYATKDFEGKGYYDYSHTSITWKLPPGIEFKAGADLNRGDFINPELNTPSNGLAFAELSVPIGDGLLRSRQQTLLQQARRLNERAYFDLEIAQREWINYAAEAFWNWKASQEVLNLRKSISKLSNVRYLQTVQRHKGGNATAMDTLEAYNQWTKRKAEELSAEMDLTFWHRLVGSMVWDRQWIDDFRSMRALPDSTWQTTASAYRLRVRTNRSLLVHPKLNALRIDQEVADLDLRLAREQVKPDIDLKARAISNPQMLSISGHSSVFGISAMVPILARKERAMIRKNRIKLEQIGLKLEATERELIQKFDQYERQLELMGRLIEMSNENARNTRRLLELENKRLLFGESTLFLINRRENSYLDAELKLIEVRLKQHLLEWKLLMLTEDPSQVLF